MKIQLHSTKNGEVIHNHTFAHEMYGVNVTVLTIRDIDDKYEPITVDGFNQWNHAYAINGKACWFCESIN